MTRRGFKKIFITFIFFGYTSLFGASFYFFFAPNPSCFDGRKNQSEEGIDCGGPCFACKKIVELKNIEILKVEWVAYDGKYDILAKIKNLNNFYGSQSFRYRAVIKNSNQELVTTSDWDQSFIIPGEVKHVLIQGVVSKKEPANIEIEVDREIIKWEKIAGFEEFEYIIVGDTYEKQTRDAFVFSKAKGQLINRSEVGFKDVNLKLILRDSSGKLLAMNSHTMNNIDIEGRRDYEMRFLSSFPGKVDLTKSSLEVETNVLDPNNYIDIRGISVDELHNRRN